MFAWNASTFLFFDLHFLINNFAETKSLLKSSLESNHKNSGNSTFTAYFVVGLFKFVALSITSVNGRAAAAAYFQALQFQYNPLNYHIAAAAAVEALFSCK